MSASVLMERSGSVAAPIGGAAPIWQGASAPTSFPANANWCVVPRCKLEFEKCAGGFKIHCRCDDEVSCGTLQNLCRMLADGLCSCYCTRNGVPVAHCCFTMGRCICECTKDGCTITCLSGDKECCAMLQACCDCLECCCESGCCCYVCFNNNPVCCGVC